jgi:hypothetical protein
MSEIDVGGYWRRVKMGEVIEAGDEYLDERHGWKQVPNFGMAFTSCLLPHRRRVPAATPAPPESSPEPVAWVATKPGDDGGYQRCIGWDREKVVDGIDDELSSHPISVTPLYTAPSAPHPWCRDVPRDVAIRAAEDAAAVTLPEWRELPRIVAGLRERVAALESAARIAPEANSDAGSNLDAAIRERDEARAECERLRQKVRVMDGQSKMDIEAEIAVEEAWESCDIRPHWPDDEPGTSHRYAESMRLEIVRLRSRVAALEAAASRAPTCEAGNPAHRTLAAVAAAMDCQPDDYSDLVEAVRCLVRERDEAREKAACVIVDLFGVASYEQAYGIHSLSARDVVMAIKSAGAAVKIPAHLKPDLTPAQVAEIERQVSGEGGR